MTEKTSDKSTKKKKFMAWSVAAVIFLGLPGGYYLWVHEINANFHEVVPEKVYRSAQPEPEQLRGWIDKYEIRTILNLRGDAGRETQDEQIVADQTGVTMLTVELSAYRLPTRKALLEVIEILETAEPPILLHCRQGMDRSGTVSALAAMLIGGEPYEKAKGESWIPPGPWKRKSHTNYVHISDMFELYEDYCEANGKNPNDLAVFRHWAAEVYDPETSKD